MEHKKRLRLARLTSNVLNPFVVSMVLITLLSFKSISGTFDAIKWILILIGLCMLPVLMVVIYLLHHKKLENFFINARRERHKIYLLSSFCALIASIVLPRLGAPEVFLATMVAALSSMIIFMCINFLWKISVHTAFIAATATILIVLYGFAGAISAALLPLTAWARIELDHHSLAQTITGAVLAACIVFVVFYFFGLIGHAGPA